MHLNCRTHSVLLEAVNAKRLLVENPIAELLPGVVVATLRRRQIALVTVSTLDERSALANSHSGHPGLGFVGDASGSIFGMTPKLNS